MECEALACAGQVPVVGPVWQTAAPPPAAAKPVVAKADRTGLPKLTAKARIKLEKSDI